MFPYERYKILLNAVKELQFVRTKELLKLTKSSLTTLRNDIDYLADKDKIKKIRGGEESPFLKMLSLMGSGGITEEKGLTVYDLMTATDYPKMLSIAKEIIVVADHSKIGRDVLAHIAPLDIIDTIITDEGVNPEYINMFKKYQINCVLAEVK